MKKRLAVLILFAIMSCITACGNDNSSDSEENTNENYDEEVVKEDGDDYNESSEENAEKKEGFYTVEECIGTNGFYTLYDDGSLDEYPQGGYCENFSSASWTFNGLYIAIAKIKQIEDININNNVVLFWDDDYNVRLHPVHEEINVIQLFSEEGVEGYGRLISENTMNVYYKNGEVVNVEVEYINGEPVTNYDLDEIKWSFHPYEGMSGNEYSYTLLGFKEEGELTIGSVQGSSLVEETYNVNTKYYDCTSDHNEWDEEDIYYPECVPTAEGYAELDFSNIPSGKYAMVVSDFGRSPVRYVSTLVNIEN